MPKAAKPAAKQAKPTVTEKKVKAVPTVKKIKAAALPKKIKAAALPKKIKAAALPKKNKTAALPKKTKPAALPKRIKAALLTKKVKLFAKKTGLRKLPASLIRVMAPGESGVEVLDRLFATIAGRRGADPSGSHSARLLSLGSAKVAQKFGEEAVECVIEAVAGNRDALIAESADVLYHLLVMWVDGNVEAQEVWAELERRQGVSGIAEKAARAQKLSMAFGLGTTKIP
jgi:phosphoribosyl-ATP pyrophosphohydrolase